MSQPAAARRKLYLQFAGCCIVIALGMTLALNAFTPLPQSASDEFRFFSEVIATRMVVLLYAAAAIALLFGWSFKADKLGRVALVLLFWTLALALGFAFMLMF